MVVHPAQSPTPTPAPTPSPKPAPAPTAAPSGATFCPLGGDFNTAYGSPQMPVSGFAIAGGARMSS